MGRKNKYEKVAGLSTRDKILFQMGQIQLPEVERVERKRKREQNETEDHPPPQQSHKRAKRRSKKTRMEEDKVDQDSDAELGTELVEEMETAPPVKIAKKRQKKNRKERNKIRKQKADARAAAEAEVEVESEDEVENAVDASKHKPIVAEEESNNNNSSKGTTDLRSKLLDRLKGSRFRYLNERLYTCTGTEAESLFNEDPSAFKVYHEGFLTQAQKWPLNPVNLMIRDLKNKPTDLVVADMGCGDAKLARTLKHKVHSFDLVALNDKITPCNIANVPLPSNSVDICVFCLSLMGTNLADYLREANRILKNKGVLKIAEIKSRMTSIKNFKKALEKLGFALLKQSEPNDLFILFDFEKTGKPLNKRPPGLYLTPCLYKKR